MTHRDEYLTGLRPEIQSALITINMSRDEQFQNRTLRPIAKLQDALFIEVFKNYIFKHKNTFFGLTIDKRIRFIENAIQKDIKLRNSLKGIMIGQFTLEEYRTYTQNSSSLNKRMMNIVKEGLIHNIQLLEDNEIYQKAQ